MSRPARARIDLNALQHNFNRVTELAPNKKIMAVVKADGYGHGMARIASQLEKADAFAVASIDEALGLRAAAINKPIFLLSGFHHKNELPDVFQHDLTPVIHNHEQLLVLSEWENKNKTKNNLKVWCKLDTGMHRIGFEPQKLAEVVNTLKTLPGFELVGVMSHLANADNVQSNKTTEQISLFNEHTKNFSNKSMANSAGIVAWQESHMHWLRPGIMLYGSSPVLNQSAAALKLLPVMTLESEIIAIKKMKKNDAIGYGGDWICPENMCGRINRGTSVCEWKTQQGVRPGVNGHDYNRCS
jgi:alanine racemase